MSARSFTVFLDTPSEDTTDTKPTTSNNITSLKRSSSSSSVTTLTPSASASSVVSPLSAGDKENFDPLTGERAVTGLASGKKRKTSVLVTKSLELKPTSKDKDTSDAQPEAKKRKSSASSAVKTKSKKDAKGLGSGTGKKVTRKSSRRTSPMPKVEEEAESDKETQRMSQEQIDARCYDLTVKPLADVSEAYGSSSLLSIVENPSDDETPGFTIVKEASAEPEIRDYFNFSLSASSSTTLRGSSPAVSEPKSFSTPERKKIYAAFTFTSPSPSSDRFAKAKRASSVPRLDLGATTSRS